MSSSTRSPSTQLRADAVGTLGIVLIVLAFAAPLAAIMGVGPLVLGSSGSAGAPGAFAITTVILLVFSVGFAAMSRQHSGPGGFAVYIGLAWGKRFAEAASFVAVLGYNAFLIGNLALFGVTTAATINPRTGVDVPWWAYCLLAIAIMAFLGYREVQLSVKVLGVLLVLEMVIILVLDVAVILQGGAEGLDVEGFAPSALSQGAIGIVMLFAFACFVGFEATTLFGEEARDPHRTIPRATYAAVVVVGVFYTLVIWVFQQGWGSQVAARADGDAANFIFDLNTAFVSAWSTDVMQWLVVTSIFAAVLSLHSALSRYMFSMGREGVLPTKVGTTHPTTRSPHVASGVQTVVTVAVYAVLIVVGADPVAVVYSWFVGVGAVAVLLLYMTSSLAVSTALRRSEGEQRVWVSTVAPVAAAVAMAGVLYLAVTNFSVLTGSDDAVVNSLWLTPVLIGGLGFVLASRRRSATTPEKVGVGS